MSDPAPQPTPQVAPHAAPQAAPPPPASQPASQPAPTPSSPPPGEERNARLLTSIDDAYTLLDFAARRAMKPDGAITAPIIQCHDKIATGAGLSAEEETVFWQAFSSIIEMVKPVTVESILFTSERTARARPRFMFGKWASHTTPADRVLRHYLWVAVLSLLALLALQVEWAIGMSTYNDAFEVHGYLLATNDKVVEARQLHDALTATTANSAAVSPTALNAKARLETLQNRQSLDRSWDDVSYVRLWWWNRQMASYIPPYDLSIDRKGPPSEAGVVKLGDEGLRRIEFTRAQLTLEVISNYVLVTLFALLGSMTQALRRLSAEIASVSLTTNSLYRIRTRIILGVISGVCMAWLLIISAGTFGGNVGANVGESMARGTSMPLSSISFLGAFTPWAVAFISGYSVEIFFAALERAIAIITTRIQGFQPIADQRPEAPASQPPAAPPQPQKSPQQPQQE